MEILANSLTMETAYMYHKNRYSEKVPRYIPKQKRTTVNRYTGFTAHLYVYLAYMLHVFGNTVDTCLENKYKYGLAIGYLSKIKSKQKLMKNNTVL